MIRLLLSTAIGRAAACVALCAAPLVGCTTPDPPAVPTAPSVDDLLLEFDAIDGTLDADTARILVEDAVTDLATLAVIGVLMAELDSAADELDKSAGEAQGSQSQGLAARNTSGGMPQEAAGDRQRPDRGNPHVGERGWALNLQAGTWARLTHICPGTDREVVDAANGRIQLTSVFDALAVVQDGLDRVVVWGDARDCLLATDGDVNTLDATIAGAMTLNDSNDLILSIVGGLTASSGEPAAFDLRLRQQGERFELLRTVEGNGSFLIGVAQLDDGLTEATVADRDGAWVCAFDADAETGECARDGEVVSWP